MIYHDPASLRELKHNIANFITGTVGSATQP
jgi:hypothetical protein